MCYEIQTQAPIQSQKLRVVCESVTSFNDFNYVNYCSKSSKNDFKFYKVTSNNIHDKKIFSSEQFNIFIVNYGLCIIYSIIDCCFCINRR